MYPNLHAGSKADVQADLSLHWVRILYMLYVYQVYIAQSS